jgi:hypothetical protein
MTRLIFFGIGAGLAATLLFVAPLGGSGVAFPLFALTGLPIAIAGLGWTPLAGAVAAVTGAVAISFVLSPVAALIFLLIFGGPVVWATRLAGLSRAVNRDEPDSPVEWYPLGRLLFHLCLAASLGILVTAFIVGFNVEEISKELTDALVVWLGSSPDIGSPPTAEDLAPLVRFNVAAMPFTTSAITVVILVFDLWLAGWITRLSGRLARPRDRLWATEFPREAVIVLALAVVLAFLPRPLGDIAGVFAGALGTASAIIGLAVMHALTIGHAARGIILTVAYAALILLGFPIFLFALLGIGESLFHFRARRFGAAPPKP